MKKIFLTFIAFVCFASMVNAQWVSPGNGTTYTMSDLVTASNGAVTSLGNNTYSINTDITISAGDTWNVTGDVVSVSVEEVTITINGTMNAEGSAMQRIPFIGNRVFYTVRFENAEANIHGVNFVEGEVISIINSNVSFVTCEFKQFNGTSAVSYMNCNPVFNGCHFYDNQGAAIGSGINVQGSPTIRSCIFENNDRSNQNLPQINIGPGAIDTIYIMYNTITNGNSMSGGISISDIAGVGSTRVRIEGNTITNNRYGINQQGKTISSVICHNTIVENNLETNPNNGGSGISIYGLTTDCKSIIRYNTIVGNIWGITAISQFDIDLGTMDDYGHNVINKNMANGEQIDLYNYSAIDIQAVGNYWGTTDGEDIRKHIYDKEDDNSLGEVFYKPYLENDGIDENQSVAVSVAPNPVTNGTMTITFEKEVKGEVLIYNAAGQAVMTQYIENQVNNIDINNLESGVYFVVIRGNEGNKVEKIVKR